MGCLTATHYESDDQSLVASGILEVPPLLEGLVNDKRRADLEKSNGTE